MREYRGTRLHELIETCKIVGDGESKFELARFLADGLRRGTMTAEKVREIRLECHITSAYYIAAEMELMELMELNESEENEE